MSAYRVGVRPSSPFLACAIDLDIVPLVEALNTASIVTTCSCSGHGDEPVEIAVMVKLVAIRDLTEAVDYFDRSEGRSNFYCDLKVMWNQEIVSIGDTHPGWVAMNLRFYRRHSRPLTCEQMLGLSKAFGKALPYRRPLRNLGVNMKRVQVVGEQQMYKPLKTEG